jgi:hypothetical protein
MWTTRAENRHRSQRDRRGDRVSKRKGNKTGPARHRLEQGQFVRPSPEQIRRAQSGNGGWTAMQLAEWGVPWPPERGWRYRLEAAWCREHGLPEPVREGRPFHEKQQLVEALEVEESELDRMFRERFGEGWPSE